MGDSEIEIAPAALRLEKRGKGLVAVPEKPLPRLTAGEVRERPGAHPAVKAVDTSVVVAAFASWHEHHLKRRTSLLDQDVRLIEHCSLETYSVLTRLPAPHRCPGRNRQGLSPGAIPRANAAP